MKSRDMQWEMERMRVNCHFFNFWSEEKGQGGQDNQFNRKIEKLQYSKRGQIEASLCTLYLYFILSYLPCSFTSYFPIYLVPLYLPFFSFCILSCSSCLSHLLILLWIRRSCTRLIHYLFSCLFSFLYSYSYSFSCLFSYHSTTVFFAITSVVSFFVGR